METEIHLLKNDLRKTIKKQFKKTHNNCNLPLSNSQLVQIYSDTLKKLLEVIPNNINNETFLQNILLSED